MPEAADILARLDAIMAELAELRAEVVASLPAPEGNGLDVDDLAPENLLDTHAASARFGFPRDTIAKWCREECLGVKVGGRWLASAANRWRH
jgi:hypothetical protein